jgi:oligosaccharyltransferase complex subunit delta (ribophorin II)
MRMNQVIRLNYPNILSEKIEVDFNQKLMVKFQVKDVQSNEYIRVQQAFLRLTNKKSQKEIIYLAEATGGVNAQYKVEVVRRNVYTSEYFIFYSFDYRRI